MVDTKWFRGRMVFTKYINILIIHLKRKENGKNRFLIVLFYDLGLSLKPRSCFKQSGISLSSA